MHSDNEVQLSLFDQTPQPLLSADEMFDVMDEARLRNWAESNRLEYKSSAFGAKGLGNYFSMWANTQPDGGIVVIGVADDKKLEGIAKLEQLKINEILRAGHVYCPDAEIKHKEIKIIRDADSQLDIVLAFRVKYHPTKVVRTSSGDVFRRIGGSKVQLTDEQIRLLQSEKGEINFEKEPCGLKYPSDFRRDEIAKFADTVRSKKSWREHHSDEEVLKLLHLGTRSGGQFIPNFACALLFANDPREVVPGCRVRFLRFEGTEERSGKEWNAVKDEWLDGTAPDLILQIENVLKSQLRNFSRLGPGGKFTTSP